MNALCLTRASRINAYKCLDEVQRCETTPSYRLPRNQTNQSQAPILTTPSKQLSQSFKSRFFHFSLPRLQNGGPNWNNFGLRDNVIVLHPQFSSLIYFNGFQRQKIILNTFLNFKCQRPAYVNSYSRQENLFKQIYILLSSFQVAVNPYLIYITSKLFKSQDPSA